MKMNTISMKQLREEFPLVKERFENGEELLLIYRSKPLVKMTPIKKGRKKKEKKLTLKEKLELVDKLAGGLKLGKWTPEELNELYDKQYEEMLP